MHVAGITDGSSESWRVLRVATCGDVSRKKCNDLISYSGAIIGGCVSTLWRGVRGGDSLCRRHCSLLVFFVCGRSCRFARELQGLLMRVSVGFVSIAGPMRREMCPKSNLCSVPLDYKGTIHISCTHVRKGWDTVSQHQLSLNDIPNAIIIRSGKGFPCAASWRPALGWNRRKLAKSHE